jgi:hypothetical protein
VRAAGTGLRAEPLGAERWLILEGQRPFSVVTGPVFTPTLLVRVAAARDFDVRARLGGITAPTPVLCGRHDAVMPLPHSERLRRAIPGAELVVLERSAHVPVPALPDYLGRFRSAQTSREPLRGCDAVLALADCGVRGCPHAVVLAWWPRVTRPCGGGRHYTHRIRDEALRRSRCPVAPRQHRV